jgi:hypothetical protein
MDPAASAPRKTTWFDRSPFSVVCQPYRVAIADPQRPIARRGQSGKRVGAQAVMRGHANPASVIVAGKTAAARDPYPAQRIFDDGVEELAGG